MLKRSFLIWCVGGLIYGGIEILWRGYTHWTMILLAAVISIPLDAFNESIGWDWPLLKQALVGGTVITLAEMAAGLVLNVWLGLHIWDYSQMWGNLLGQICPQYWAAWVLLAGVAIVVFDWLRYLLFHEERPKYRLI